MRQDWRICGILVAANPASGEAIVNASSVRFIGACASFFTYGKKDRKIRAEIGHHP
jgi:hypothetical protein